MWSRPASAASKSADDTPILPSRTRSKASSKWWTKADRAGKPNIAPPPFSVCSARKTESTASAEASSSRSSSICSSWPKSSRASWI